MSLNAHHLVSTIKNGDLMFLGMKPPTTPQYISEIGDDINEAQKFDVGVVDSLEFDYEQEPLTGNQPFPYFYFEIDIEVNHHFADSDAVYTHKHLAFFSVQEGSSFSIFVFCIYPDKCCMEAVLPVFGGDVTVTKGRCFDLAFANKYFGIFKKVIALLNCTNITTEVKQAPEKLNKKRLKRGKAPLYSYHVVTIKKDAERNAVNKGEYRERATPRLHLRRGHVRQLPTGKATWVQPAVVGAVENGVISKEYKFSI